MKSYKLLLFAVALIFLICPDLQAQNQTPSFYVNATTGIDLPTHGSTAYRPWKTVGYALDRVRITRPRSDVETTVNVAAGQYSESIIIDLNNIWLKGAGSNVTSLVGDGTSNVLQLTGPIKSHITGFTIQNGGEGLYSVFASVVVENCVIANNAGYAGIDVLNGSLMTLKNTNVNNNQVGITVDRNATAIMDSCNVFGNSGVGLEVAYSSSARVMNCAVYSNSNGLAILWSSNARLTNCAVYSNSANGIQVGGASSLRMSLSAVHDNALSGVDLYQMSTLGMRGGNSVYANADFSGWRGGVHAGGGSNVDVAVYDTQVPDAIYNNNGPGLSIQNNSSLIMNSGEVNNNQGDGIALWLGSSGQGGSGASITGNAGYGISCANGSVAWGTPGNISGNTSGPTNCE